MNTARTFRSNAIAIRALVLRMKIRRLLLLMRAKRVLLLCVRITLLLCVRITLLLCVIIRRMSLPLHVSDVPCATS